MTSELILSIKLKSKYFKLYRSGRISKQLNNQMRNNVNNKVKESIEKYLQNMFNLNWSDIKKSWTELSLLLGRKKPRTSKKELVVEGTTITADIQMVEAMNEWFASVGSTLDSQLPTANNHENIPLQQRFEFFLIPVSTSEYSKTITNLKNT